MIEERELWACAQQIIRQHGEGVTQYLADRVAALTEKGDHEGVATWVAIADRVDRLNDMSGAGGARH